MSLHKARIEEFSEVMFSEELDLERLQKLAFHGVPDIKGMRATVWKFLLNYLPKERSKRLPSLKEKRRLYEQFIGEIIVSPADPSDHPLNMNPDSSWCTYFKDNEVLLQIDKDVRRLRPDMSFFQSPTHFPCMQVVNSNGTKRLHQRVEQSVLAFENMESRGLGLAKLYNGERERLKKVESDYAPQPEGGESHWEVVERMLFLYAKLNPGQGYVQGMNEIIGPIYHTFAIDPTHDSRKNAEADCFFCFTNLMSEIRDFFLRTMDEAEGGIKFMMEKLSNCLRKNDPEIFDRLASQELRPEYYSFRWITLMLSQEFALPDVQRLWDSLFSAPSRFNFLIEICCAMLLLVKEQLMMGDFSANVQLLQNYPPMDVALIIAKAAHISEN